MTHKIKKVEAKENLILEVSFFDGTVKVYDVTLLFDVFPQMRVLKENKELFQSVQVDCGGYGISWNEELDIDAEEIWEEGTVIAKGIPETVLSLAYQLSVARNQAGMTQKELSQKTGIYQADISKIERGIGNPSISTLQRLAEGIGMKLKIEFY